MSGALRIQVQETVLIIDGGPNAELPAGSGGPVLAGPEAIFVMGRIAADAPTLLTMGAPGGEGRLTLAHSGALATPDRRIRVVTVEGEVLGEVGVSDASTPLRIFLSDDVEPDEIYVSLPEASPFKSHSATLCEGRRIHSPDGCEILWPARGRPDGEICPPVGPGG